MILKKIFVNYLKRILWNNNGKSTKIEQDWNYLGNMNKRKL